VAAGERDEFIRVDFPIAAGGKVTGFRAIEGWEYPFQPGGSLLVEPEFLLLAYDQIVGAMDEEARQIANRERTLLGRLIRFIGYPIELRENLRQQYPSIAKAGIPAGITVQILVAVTIAALSTLAVRAVDAAIEAVTPAPASTETPSPAPNQ
jgi:hypothetical protein